MSDTSNHIDILIGKCVSGNASHEEMQELEAWKSESKRNLSIFQAAVKAWQNSENYLSALDLQTDRQKIETEIISRQSAQIRKYQLFTKWLKIASILAIPLLVARGWYITTNSEQSVFSDQYCEIMAPSGNISKCILPDGTEVWLNTNSVVRYDVASFNKNEREVNIEGEAYFEVAKNKQKPFRVLTSEGSILVTGTSFNVKAYPGDNVFETVLTEGSIEMKINNESQSVKLIPGERAVYNNEVKKITISEVNPERYSSWRNGELFFDDATLNDLIKELSRVYSIEFILEDKELGQSRFRGMFSFDNNLIDALEKIKRTSGIDYVIKNKEVRLSKINTIKN